MWRLVPLVLLIYSFIVHTKSYNLNAIITELSAASQAETVIHYNLNQQLILSNTTVPQLIVTTETYAEWRANFNANVLSIVYMEDDAMLSAKLQSTLNATLYRWYHTDVLFVANSKQLSSATAQALFKWCWQIGFYNVLLTNHNATLLQTYLPFPSVQLKAVTLQQHLTARNNWRNLQGYNIRAVVGSHTPRVYIHFNSKGELILHGLMAEYLKLFIAHYNATLQMEFVRHNYSLPVCHRYLELAQAQICVDIFIQTQSHIISNPLYIHHGYIMVPYAPQVKRFKIFVVPFSWNVWLLLGVAIAYITFMLSLLHYKQVKQWHIGQFLLIAISSFLAMDFSLKALRGKSIYLIFFVLLLAGGSITKYYLTQLSSILNTNVFEAQIETLADIKARNISVWYMRGDNYVYDAFSLSRLEKQLLVDVNMSIFMPHRTRLDARYAYICFTDACEVLMYQQKFMLRPRMTILSKPVVSVWAGFPIANNWPLERLFNIFLLRIFELGFYKQFLIKTMETAIRYGHISFFQTEYYRVVPMGMDYFQMPAILLCIGYTLASLSFLLEHIFSAKKKKMTA